MIKQQLFDYIKQQLQQGVSQEQIKNSLIANGWQAQDVDEVFAFIQNFANHSQYVPSPTQGIPLLPSATAIFGQAWAIYKQRLGTFLGIMTIPMLIMVVLIAVLTGDGFLDVILLSSKFASGGFSLLILLKILFWFIVVISQTWGQTALLYAIKDNQERIGVVESYRRGWHKIISYWWVLLLTGFIMFGGFLLLIVPGIIFSVWFSLAIFILIAEDLTGMNALLKSREYVKGKWGGVFWRLFFMGALSLIISSVLNLISWLLQIPFGLIITLFWVPLAMTYSFLIYSNLKSLKGEIVFAPTSGEKVPFILVAIFGISVIFTMLFSVIFGVFGPVSARERDKKRQADINQIRSGLELYYVKHNNYPSSLNELSSEYFLDLPVDPLTKQSYQYQLQQNGTDYKVCAQLELTKTQKCVTSQE